MRWQGADGIPLQRSGKWTGPVKTVMNRVGLRQPVMILLDIVTYVLEPNSLTLWSRVLLEKITGFQPLKKFPAFYGTRWFITAFTSAHHLSLS